MRRSPHAFTLVELLVVISIIVILVSILVPGMERAMAASQRGKCATNLSSIGKALGTYLNDSIARVYPNAQAGGVSSEYALFGKRGEPYDTGDPHSQANMDSDKRPLNKYLGITGAKAEVKVAECPSDQGDAITNTSNAYKTKGSSYAAAVGTSTTGNVTNSYKKGVQSAFSNPAMQASAAKPASSKILVGDSPWQGDRFWAMDRKHRWHSGDKTKRQHNILFADYHVEFFEFKKDAMDATKFEIETNAADAKPQPGRGYW